MRRNITIIGCGLFAVGLATTLFLALTSHSLNSALTASGTHSNQSCIEESYFKNKFIEFVSTIRSENDLAEDSIKKKFNREYGGEIVDIRDGFEYKIDVCPNQSIVIAVDEATYDKESNGMKVAIRFRSPRLINTCAFSVSNVSNSPLLSDFDKRIIRGHPLSGELWVFQKRGVSAVFSAGAPGRLDEAPNIICINSVSVFAQRD